jgi:hypothetical protein
VLTIVVFHAFLAQQQLDLERARERTAVAQRRYDAARLEYAQLASPEHITQRAAELGLVVPSRSPVAVPVAGPLPKGIGPERGQLAGWGEVKRHLDSSP